MKYNSNELNKKESNHWTTCNKTTHVLRGHLPSMERQLDTMDNHNKAYLPASLVLPLPNSVNVKTDSEPISLQPKSFESQCCSISFSFVQLTSSPSVPHAGHSESIQASISIFTTARGSRPTPYHCWDSVVPRWVMGV